MLYTIGNTFKKNRTKNFVCKCNYCGSENVVLDTTRNGKLALICSNCTSQEILEYFKED